MDKPPPGKYGRKNRASRTRKRKYYGRKSNTTSEGDIPEVVLTQEALTEEESVEIVQPVHLNIIEDRVRETGSTSASAKKLKTINEPEIEVDAPIDCNIIINTALFINLFEKLSKCPECGGKVYIRHEAKKKKGLAHFFSIKCSSEICDWADCLPTSRTVKSAKKGQKSYELNLRTCIAFQEMGKGYKNIRDFCKIMNIPPPMDSKSYRKNFTILYRAYTEVAFKSTTDAALQVEASMDESGVKNITASFDGTWQRRGYASLNGVVGCISQGKVVEYELLCKVCPQCKYWHSKQPSDEYEEWKRYHHCSINHTGSAGSMEAAGVNSIYNRSVLTRKLRYTTYLGDGDSKSFQDMVKLNPYPGHTLNKLECIGNVQKRVGARLRTYKAVHKKVLSDGKKLCGAGRLTNKQ